MTHPLLTESLEHGANVSTLTYWDPARPGSRFNDSLTIKIYEKSCG
jgi:hypothetical protein